MTSIERTFAALSHQEPDLVPLFLLPTLHGARELGLSIRDYFSRPENVVEGQARLRARYGHDCVTAFHYAPLETEAWGGGVFFREDGPPNSAEPVIRRPEDILRLEPPEIASSPALARVLRATELLRKRVGGEVPIVGVVVSPFSAPVMQMGFDCYLDLISDRGNLFERLLSINERFCVNWARAQIKAGATAICYFDPLSSPDMTAESMLQAAAFPAAQRCFSAIPAPGVMHLASGRSLGVVEDVIAAGAKVLSASCNDDLAALKARCARRIGVIGNLNAIEMRHWTPAQAEARVKDAIAKAGSGGGFLLSDNHGEIPWQVSDATLMAVAEAARRWGRYPLEWVEEYEGQAVRSSL